MKIINACENRQMQSGIWRINLKYSVHKIFYGSAGHGFLYAHGFSMLIYKHKSCAGVLQEKKEIFEDPSVGLEDPVWEIMT